MAQKGKGSGRIIAIAMIVFGLIFAAIGGGLTYVSYDFSTRAIASSGIVTDVQIHRSSGGSNGNSSGPTYQPTIAYTDQNGTRQSGQTFLSSSSYNFPVGTKVSILFDPHAPGHIRMDSWFALWGFGLIFLLFGVLIAGVGWLVRVLAKRRVAGASPTAAADVHYSSHRPAQHPPAVRRRTTR